jgi:hypothetical protein
MEHRVKSQKSGYKIRNIGDEGGILLSTDYWIVMLQAVGWQLLVGKKGGTRECWQTKKHNAKTAPVP